MGIWLRRRSICGFRDSMYDQETGLHYNYFRTYDPSTGRYLESDPAGIAPGPNTYAYAWSNPLGFTDRFGLDPNVDLGQGYSGRVDQFDYKGQSSFEIHVFDKNGKEVGVYGPNGWINKHGHSGRPPGIPADVENQCKGKAVELGRRSGQIPDKGKGNIKGDRWKNFFRRAPLIGPLIEMTRPSPEHLCDIDPANEICAN